MEAKDKAFSHKKTLLVKGNLMNLSDPKVMGIINATPDSFYDGGKNNGLDSALKTIEQMVKDGVDILDIGGYSTKPNAKEVSLEQENERVLPLIELVKKNFPDSEIHWVVAKGLH